MSDTENTHLASGNDELTKRYQDAFTDNYGTPASRWSAARARSSGTPTATSTWTCSAASRSTRSAPRTRRWSPR